MKRAHLTGIAVAAVALLVTLFIVFGLRRDAKEPAGQNVSAVGKKRSPRLSQKGALKSAVKPVAVRPPAERVVTNKMGLVMRSYMRGRIGGAEDDVFRDATGKAYPQKDQELMRLARYAIDNDDLDSARALAAEAVSSSNDELRSMAVDALAWFGKDTLVELTQYMADANEEVAEAAKDGWMGGLQELDDDGTKAGVVEATMKSISNADMLEDVANELIGIDELAAIQALVNIIEDGKNVAAVPAAKEAYNFITGEDWASIDAAEDWLQKNYEPDE